MLSLVQQQDNPKNSRVQLQVGSTQWELESNMPTLQANAHTFMFALPGAAGQQIFYSLLLANDTPVDAVSTLVAILEECTSFQVAGKLTDEAREQITQEVAESLVHDEAIVGQVEPELGGIAAPPSTAAGTQRKASERIQDTASWITQAIGVGAQYASGAIAQAGEKLQQRVAPNAQPYVLDPKTKDRIKRCRKVAQHASATAGAVAGTVTDMSFRVADSIVRRMSGSNYGTKLQSNTPTRRSAAKDIASASVVAAAEIYESMYLAGQTVLKQGGSSTAQFVGHKYGPDVGEAAQDVATSTVDVGTAYYTMSRMGVRAIAKRIAKRTAKGLVKGQVQNARLYQGGQAAAVSGPPMAAGLNATSAAATVQPQRAEPPSVAQAGAQIAPGQSLI
jgi:spartin